MGKPYVEPEDYIPEELRKKYKLGEYNEDVEQEEPEHDIAEKDNVLEYVDGAKPPIMPQSLNDETEETKKSD